MAGQLAYLDRSLLSCLTRTLGVFSEAKSAATGSGQQELDTIRSFFKSTALSSSTELLEQAKTILNSTSDPLQLYSEDGDIAAVANVKDRPQGRRPDLGLKRARFKPSASQFLLSVDTKSSINHIEDPEEYFLAFKKLENADKELKKLRGEVSTDSCQDPHYTVARQRRPGILGKTTSYKHHFPINADNAETLVLSQERDQNFSPSKATDGFDLFDATQGEGSVTDKEKRVNYLLDTLLSSFEGLDEGEETAVLRKCLKIKPIGIDKMRLPVFDRFQGNDERVMNGKMIGKKMDGSGVIQTSTTPTSNPLAAISIIQRRISQIDLLKDPYSLPSIYNRSSPKHSIVDEGRDNSALSDSADIYQTKMIGLNSKDASTPMKSMGSRLSFKGNLQSPITEADNTISSKVDLAEHLTEDSPCPPDRVSDYNSSIFDRQNAVRSIRFDGCSDAKVDDMLLEVSIAKQPGPDYEDLRSGTLTYTGTEGSDRLFDNRVPSDSRLDIDINVSSVEFGYTADDKVNEIMEEAPTSQDKDQSSLDAGTTLSMDGCSENSSVLAEQNNEENQAAARDLVNRQVKKKVPPQIRSKRKRRQSLEAGTMWESGVRRSTRIKMRPLEYWRGERFLYGRIHDSLATVIGLKYASPTKDGEKSVLKVKSYVSEEHANLVEKVAMH